MGWGWKDAGLGRTVLKRLYGDGRCVLGLESAGRSSRTASSERQPLFIAALVLGRGRARGGAGGVGRGVQPCTCLRGKGLAVCSWA